MAQENGTKTDHIKEFGNDADLDDKTTYRVYTGVGPLGILWGNTMELKMNTRDDLLEILDIILADMAEDIWVASEYSDFDIRKLYVYPDKRFKEFKERISELWGEQ